MVLEEQEGCCRLIHLLFERQELLPQFHLTRAGGQALLGNSNCWGGRGWREMVLRSPQRHQTLVWRARTMAVLFSPFAAHNVGFSHSPAVVRAR